MRIGILSDTHDHLENIDRAFALFGDRRVEMIVHLGDWVAPYTVSHVVTHAARLGVPLKGVLGNNDGELFGVFGVFGSAAVQGGAELRQHTFVLDVDDRKVILYHGTDTQATDALIRCGAYDAVFTGHTHVPDVRTVGRTLAVNPGTLSGFSASRGGQLREAEVAIYSSDANAAEIVSFSIPS